MSPCPGCGAHNPEHARWCGQCLQPFGAPAPGGALDTRAGDRAGDRAVGRSASAGAEVDGDRFPSVPPAPAPAGAADTGAFLAEGGQVRWRCPACEAVNDLELLECVVCGTALADLERSHVPWDLARQRAVLGPGLGHLVAGHGVAGWARLLLAGVWLLGALGLLATGGLSALAPAASLLAGVAIVWVGGVIDVQRLAHGREELITPRVLLWVVVGVLVGVLATLLVRVPTPAAAL